LESRGGHIPEEWQGLFVGQLPGLKGLEGANGPLVDEESKAQKDQAYFKASHD